MNRHELILETKLQKNSSTLYRFSDLIIYVDVKTEEDYIKKLHKFIKECPIRKWKEIRKEMRDNVLLPNNIRRWGHVIEIADSKSIGLNFFDNKLHIHNKSTRFTSYDHTVEYYVRLERNIREYFENVLIEHYKNIDNF